MLLRVGFNQCCEIVGRASAIIALAGMASLVFSATAIDVLRLPSGHLGWAAQSPLWIKSRHGKLGVRSYPKKRTSAGHVAMSAKCQSRQFLQSMRRASGHSVHLKLSNTSLPRNLPALRC